MAESGAPLRIAIVAEHASARFGGEAALPLHWFRMLRRRGHDVWLVSHARTRAELEALFPDDARVLFVDDTWFHKAMHRIGRRLPARIAYLTVGFALRVSAQRVHRRIARRLVREEGVNIVHQPIPVSPREPSLLSDVGAPVFIGPMNGGMEYPPGFRGRKLTERFVVGAGRAAATVLNRLMPGKLRAAVLLVANERTRRALPPHRGHVVELVENGVDLDVFDIGFGTESAPEAPARSDAAATFVYMGRLVDWKRVDLLLDAFARASSSVALRLVVVGSGAEHAALEAKAKALRIAAADERSAGVSFTGWLSQADCARRLASADALVLPSVLECGGAVVLEAMAMAKPVIATAWGGPLDYLDPSCGILVPPQSPEALMQGLAEAMLRLARSPDERARMGNAGRAKVLREYDWNTKVDRMLAVYRSVIRGGAAR